MSQVGVPYRWQCESGVVSRGSHDATHKVAKPRQVSGIGQTVTYVCEPCAELLGIDLADAERVNVAQPRTETEKRRNMPRDPGRKDFEKDWRNW